MSGPCSWGAHRVDLKSRRRSLSSSTLGSPAHIGSPAHLGSPAHISSSPPCASPLPSRKISASPCGIKGKASTVPLLGNIKGSPCTTRGLGSPDIRCLKLAPLTSTPGSPRRCQEDPSTVTKTRLFEEASWAAAALNSSTFEEASWAAATLSSLAPQVSSTPSSPTPSEPVAIAQFSREQQAIEQERQCLAAALCLHDTAEVEKHSTLERPTWNEVDPVDAFSKLDGGPSVEEALARLTTGSEGLSQAELKRMHVAFCRHKEADSSEVQKEDLSRLLSHLGYFFAKQEEVERLALKVSDFSTFDFQEFEHLTMDFCAFELEEIRKVYDSFDHSSRNQVLAADIENLLRALGIVTLQAVVRDVLEIAHLQEDSNLSFNDFLRILAAYRAVEGCTRAQIAGARKVFEDAASPSLQGGIAMKATRKVLASALLQAYGERAAAQLPQLFEGIHWDGYKETGISFHEFMVWARKLQDIQLKQLDIHYHTANKDAQGLISVDELPRMLKSAGFTIFSRAIEEILTEMNATRDVKLDFSGYVRVLKACQKRDGFTHFEREELVSAFRRFDYYGSGDIDHLELLDLLRYLGYSSHLKDVYQFVGQVDFNGNGHMDLGEFLYLMRLHREDQLVSARNAYDEEADAGELSTAKIEDTLEKLGHAPRRKVLKMLLNDIGSPEKLTFEEFVEVGDHFRRLSTAEKRKRAGFSDEEFGLIRKLFEKHNLQQKDWLEKGELILLLIDAGINMNTAEVRNEIFTTLEKARESACNAGIDGELLGRPSTPRCTFWPLVHLLRAVFHKDEDAAVRRDDQAVDETRFEPAEVQEFRTIFLECCRFGQNAYQPFADSEEAQSSPPMRRRQSLPAASSSSSSGDQRLSRLPPRSAPTATARPMAVDNSDRSLKEFSRGSQSGVASSLQGIQAVLFSRRMNMRLSTEQRQELEAQARKTTGREDGIVDFADFLRLMKWLLQANFSKINEVAEKVVKDRSESKEDESKGPPTMKSLTLAVTAAVTIDISRRRGSV